MPVRFTWDPRKARTNLRDHKVSFELAMRVWGDPLMQVEYDRFQDGEHRYHAIGVVGSKLLLVVFANPDPQDEDWVHIISAREATTHERLSYEQG